MSSRSPAGRPAALLAVRITPADVGRRVTVRRRIEDGRLSDVVGVLEAWSDGELVIRNRRGEDVAVGEEDVAAAKVVAPGMSAEAMQRVAQAGWPPFETAPLGEWVMRASEGVTGRANSVRVDGDPGMPLAEALERITAWYAERGLVPSLQVPVPSRWDAELERRGWRVARETQLRTGDTEDLVSACGDPDPRWTVARSASPSEEFLAFVEPGLPPQAIARILTGPEERVHVQLRDAAGTVVAAGRASAAASPVGRWAGITSILVAEHARRQGLATQVMGELARWGLAQGCTRTYLQALRSNAPAAALYERLGLHVHHSYEYRSPGALSSR